MEPVWDIRKAVFEPFSGYPSFSGTDTSVCCRISRESNLQKFAGSWYEDVGGYCPANVKSRVHCVVFALMFCSTLVRLGALIIS